MTRLCDSQLGGPRQCHGHSDQLELSVRPGPESLAAGVKSPAGPLDWTEERKTQCHRRQVNGPGPSHWQPATLFKCCRRHLITQASLDVDSESCMCTAGDTLRIQVTWRGTMTQSLVCARLRVVILGDWRSNLGCLSVCARLRVVITGDPTCFAGPV